MIRQSFKFLALLVLANQQMVFAQTDSANPTAAPAVSNSVVTANNSVVRSNNNGQIYEELRLIWDDCYQLRNIGQDLCNEGNNAAPRKQWLTYFVTTVGQLLPKLANETKRANILSDLDPALQLQWQGAQPVVDDMQANYLELQTKAREVTENNNDKFPPIYWRPAKALIGNADQLNKVLFATYGVLGTNQDLATVAVGMPPGFALTNSVTSSPASTSLSGRVNAIEPEPGFKSIGEAGTRVSKASFGLIGELERWNLLYGKPPAGGTADMFYGGGLTKEEVLSQYRYLPSMVFTTPSYVMLYSYRLPPRQNMLAHYTAQVGTGLNLMESELNDIKIPPDKEEVLSGPWEELKKTFLDARSQYLNLYALVNATSDEQLQKSIRQDELAIGAPVSQIYNDMDKLQRLIADLQAMVKL